MDRFGWKSQRHDHARPFFSPCLAVVSLRLSLSLEGLAGAVISAGCQRSFWSWVAGIARP